MDQSGPEGGLRPTLAAAVAERKPTAWRNNALIDTRTEFVRRDSELREGSGSAGLRLLEPPSAVQREDGWVRILIVDDHEVVRRGLRAFLDLDPTFEVVGDAHNGAQAVRMAHRLRPDVVLMDLLMPELDGIAATGVIRRELPDTQVVVLTSILDDVSLSGAFRAGAIGYMLKDATAPALRQAIKAAAAGQMQLSGDAAMRLMRGAIGPEKPDALSDCETDVLRLRAHGSANKQIARDLGIAEKTVKTHVSSILSKLGLRSRTQAALYAGRVGLVPLSGLGEADPPQTAA
jgi:two-component system, NarL family, response regulator LiaR